MNKTVMKTIPKKQLRYAVIKCDAFSVTVLSLSLKLQMY